MRYLKQFFSVGILSLATLGTAHAIPITHAIEFTVGSIDIPIDPRVQIGNVYSGFFAFDDGILSADGLNKAGTVSAFRIQMEDIVWDMNLQYPLSAFQGFRGPNGLNSASPGFDVIGGAITNLRGGVYGIGDFPFVDFSASAPNTFVTNNPLGVFGGSMYVHQIPEPTTLACVFIGVFVIAFSLRKVAADFSSVPAK